MVLRTRKRGQSYISALKGIQEYGTDAVGVEFRQIEGKLWELKIKACGKHHRIFYCVLKNKMYLLHAFLKKTPKTPLREIQTAKKRLKQIMEGG